MLTPREHSSGASIVDRLRIIAEMATKKTARSPGVTRVFARLQDQGILTRDVAQQSSNISRAGNEANLTMRGNHRAALGFPWASALFGYQALLLRNAVPESNCPFGVPTAVVTSTIASRQVLVPGQGERWWL
jgi:hypothetical protein